MDVILILERRIKFLDDEIQRTEDEELKSSLIKEMVALSSEYTKLEANRINSEKNMVDAAVKNVESKRKLKCTLLTGGIIVGSSIVGILLDSVTGRIERRKESKMQDSLTKMLK